ncbi:CoA pyrophosphatase [Propioniciclava coleopterorum]|uniref:CoA pyrophosphatase n=1 Tax=Propioniciclava coleopterorum TaxID=2714937 RepID=A0A6G7Y4L0_9ACTN|nr:CoA pyrophosphatase [Propioniciclava coleopterorum]QIK71824.1 CoA pyrophosphatase [Propioniciclava coleopterorum]
MTARPAALDRLVAELAEPGGGARVVRGRPAREGRKAAVMILFAGAEDAPADDLHVVIIEKSPHLRSHAGQCAFPGGGVEPQDASSEEAAFREAREEVGLRPETVDLLGVLPPAHVAVTGYDVTPVVGWWRAPHPLEIVDDIEVGAIHQLRVGDLIDPANRLTWRLPMGHRGPAFVVDDLFIWGFTGHLLDGLIALAGWERPWDVRRSQLVPERFWHRAGADTGQ